MVLVFNLSVKMRALVASLLLAGLAACSTTENFSKGAQFTPPPGPFKVAIMRPDVEVSLLTAGGMQEVNAEWSETAQTNIMMALEQQLGAQGGSILVPSKMSLDADMQKQLADLEKLHNAVGYTVYSFSGTAAIPLPTKKNVFDWTLGEDAVAVGKKLGADYGLYLIARDSFSSTGRVATQILGFASCFIGFCVAPGGGQQIILVSLVDLKTGRLVWFNVHAKQTGDLRKLDGAQASIADAIRGMPVTPQAASIKK